jgi:adenylate cyclase class IV
VRTRGTPTQTIIVVKATVNDETSSNGTARIEWEVDLAPMTLEEMDAKVLQAGFSYQAKWSRERDGYALNGNTVLCLDKNAGYGYLAEFERVIDDASLVDSTRTELLAIIESLGYAELDQTQLARMFDFYNKNWNDYYGTEKVFTLE